jgi:hypothetical protein
MWRVRNSGRVVRRLLPTSETEGSAFSPAIGDSPSADGSDKANRELQVVPVDSQCCCRFRDGRNELGPPNLLL